MRRARSGGRAHAARQEFASLTPNNTVYKLVGPVLVPQDQAEAKGNVDKRLDFIRSDMCVCCCLRAGYD